MNIVRTKAGVRASEPMADAQGFDLTLSEQKGGPGLWIELAMEDALITREQAGELALALAVFAETGRLPEPN